MRDGDFLTLSRTRASWLDSWLSPAGDSGDEWYGDGQGFSGSLVPPLYVCVCGVHVRLGVCVEVRGQPSASIFVKHFV